MADNIAGGALTGASTGAALGSVVPGIGNAVGAVGGAIIGGISGLLSGNAKKKAQAKQNALNYQMFQEQNAFNRKQWEDTNAWNSPANQRKLLEEAGYNPFLNANQMASPQASTVTSGTPNAAVAEDGFADALGNFANNVGSFVPMMEQYRSVHLDNDLKEATLADKVLQVALDSHNKRAQNKALDITNHIAEQTQTSQIERSKYEAKLSRARYELTDAQRTAQDMTNQFIPQRQAAEIEQIYANTSLSWAQKEKAVAEKLKIDKETKWLDAYTNAQIRLAYAQANYQDAMASRSDQLLPYDIAETDARTANFKEQKNSTHWDYMLKRGNYNNIFPEEVKRAKSENHWRGWNNFTNGIGHLTGFIPRGR